MHRSHRTTRLLLVAVVAALGCASAVTLGGCHADDCREALQCPPLAPPEEGPGDACVADPAAGRPEDGCGVFVSSSLGSNDNPGTRAQPVQSIAKAIAMAQEGPMRVYACAEAFAEPVLLSSGIELWGGLDCANDWKFIGAHKKTILAPEPDEIPLRVAAGGGSSKVADVRAEAADAIEASGSSIAVMVLPDAAVEILRSELVAGDGAPGAPGEDGGAVPAQGGAAGQDGGTACSESVVSGGSSVLTACGDLESIGGQGGDGHVASGTDGFDGLPEPIPNPQGMGLGGSGETSSFQCLSGKQGLDGAKGKEGEGAVGPGRIGLQGWEGKNGKDGGAGLPGQGGGGGGGRRGGTGLCGANMVRGGAGGGSGGAGGCGGKGGKGGGFGGASIGVLSLSADVALRTTFIWTGNGGQGGVGGFVEVGGAGGFGGLGGPGYLAAPVGCRGGDGGSGGNGGPGGGGLGGPSIGIAHPVGAPVSQEGVTIEIGEPGQGGLGGNPGLSSGAGEDGIAGVLVPFPQ